MIKSDYQRKDEGYQISREDMDGRATSVTIRNSDCMTRWRIMPMLEVLIAAIDNVSIVLKKRSEVGKLKEKALAKIGNQKPKQMFFD